MSLVFLLLTLIIFYTFLLFLLLTLNKQMLVEMKYNSSVNL